MEAQVEHFDLTFPFDLRMEKVYLGKTAGDTLAYVGNFRLDISLAGLLRKQVRATQLLLQETRMRWANDSTGMGIRVDVPELEIRAARWRPGTKRAMVQSVNISGGKVEFTGATSSLPDTTEGAGFDWQFLVRSVELKEVDYRMQMQSLPLLQAGLAEGRIRNAALDLGKQQVQVREVELKRGGCTIELASGSDIPEEDIQRQTGADTSGDWTVEADRLDLEQFSFEMAGLSDGKIEIELADIGLTLKEVYNRGTAVRAGLEQLRLVRPQGGEISEMKAEVDLDTVHTRLTGLLLRTPHSSLRLDATAETGITDLPGQNPIAVNLTGTVGSGDVRLFRPELAAGWKTARIDADLSYHPDLLRINRLNVAIPECITFAANGDLSGYTRPEKLNGRVHVKAKTGDPLFWHPFLGDTFTVPAGLLLTADLEASDGVVRPRINLCRQEGCADITGSYSFPTTGYNLHLKTENLDLGAFLPDQPLGALTAELYLRGIGWQPETARIGFLLELEKGEYRQHAYHDIRLLAHLRESHLEGILRSRDSAALLNLRFDVVSSNGGYNGRVEGKAERIDLQSLHFADTALQVALHLSLEGETGRDTLWATALLDSLRINEGGGFYELGKTELRLAGQPEQTTASLTSGDLQATFRADTAFLAFAACVGNWTDLLQGQIAERKIDLQQLADTLPPFRFELKSGFRNAPLLYLDTKGIWYKNLYAELGNETAKGFYARIGAEDPVIENMEADTLAFVLDQQGSEADYSLQIYGPQGLPDDFHSLRLSGRLLADGLEAAFRQQDRKEKSVIETGISLTMRDSSLQISLFPENPVFGYVPWTLNEDNRIILYPDHRIRADLALSSGERRIRLQSQENAEGVPEKLQLQVQKIDLSALSTWLPLLPRWGGNLNLDMLVYEEASALVGNGRIELENFFYEQKQVGSIQVDMNYRGTDHLSHHTAGLQLMIDGIRRLAADGEVVTASGNPSLRVDADIPSLPLQAVSAFVPDGLVDLEGDLHGDLKIRGTLEAPEMDGGFSFRNTRITPVTLGTSFAVDSSRLPIQSGEVTFRNFSLLSANKQLMRVNGTIDLTPLDRMKADLSVSARNFQAVNVRSNPRSLVFGKAYTDVNMTLKGALTQLAMTGNVRILNNTDVTYVMRNSTPEPPRRTSTTGEPRP